MADFSVVSDYVASLANRGQCFSYDKTNNPTTVIAGTYSSWLSTGFPGPGVAPSTAVVPTSATAGALAKFTNPGAGGVLHLHDVSCLSLTPPATVELWDRLSHMGGLSGTVTTSQTVNTAAIDRGDLNGIGVVGWVEVYTTLGGTARTLTVTYTNTAGTGSRTGTAAIPISMQATAMVRIVLQAGDIGIKSVQSVQLSGTTGTAGNFGITLARRILLVPTATTNVPMLRSGLDIGIPVVEASACLWATQSPFATSGLGTIRGGLRLVASA